MGIYSIRYFEPWARRNSTYFIAFAAGVLIAVSLLHIVPTAFHMTPTGPVALLGGYLALYVFNRFICAFTCEKRPDAQYGLGLVPLIGLGFHSFIDGVVYSITFSVSVFTGSLTAVGMIFHEFPEGIITYLLLLRGGFRHRIALCLAFCAAALTTPLGTLVSSPFIRHLHTPLLGTLLAISGGALLYVGATHLLPQAEREHQRFSLVSLAAGIVVALVIIATA
jgi:zinc transporter ZupT